VSRNYPKKPLADFIRSISMSLIVILTITAVLLPLKTHISSMAVSLLYLSGALYLAIAVGQGPAITTAFLTFGVIGYCFLPPHDSLLIEYRKDTIGLLAYFMVALIGSHISSLYRSSLAKAKERQKDTEILLEISQSLSSEVSSNRLLEKAVNITGNIDCVAGAAIYRYNQGTHELVASEGSWTDEDYARKPENKDITEFPLIFGDQQLGLMAVKWKDTVDSDSQLAKKILQILANQSAVALERQILVHNASRAQGLFEADKFRNTLLSSVSHELRTPLAAIEASATSLQEESVWNSSSRHELLDNIVQSARILNGLVSDFLDMSRLEAGAWSPQRDLYPVDELIGHALYQLPHDWADRLAIDIDPDMPMISVDFIQVSRVIWNLVENAFKYSPPGKPVVIESRVYEGKAEISVIDEGPGIADSDQPFIFEKFYRGSRMSPDWPSGSGLGLAICKEIAKAHDGQLIYEQRAGGGSVFTFLIPLRELGVKE
jgi:two-component system sensor histidine kinase KdpD